MCLCVLGVGRRGYTPGFSFPSLDEGDWTCSRTLVPHQGSLTISGQVAQRWVLLRMIRLPLVGRGM